MDLSYSMIISDAVADMHDSRGETLDWGTRYLVDTELDALRICYLHRNNPHGTQVRHCPNVSKFSVTVFNEFSTTISIDRS